MKYFVLATTLLMGCGKVTISDSHHEVSGEATVHVVVGVDFTACEKLPAEQQPDCIRALIDLAKAVQPQNSETAVEGIQ